jgi:catechol 2,3-dioxygenase-like lactoylglutathione lyase family enzyme
MKTTALLGDKDVNANIAVRDLDIARRFYEETLGLTPVGETSGELITFRSGSSMLNVYRSEYAGTNQATAVTWEVGNDIEGVVDALKGKGITFERYEMPGITREGDIHLAGDMKVAWFKDPDGNILNLASG